MTVVTNQLMVTGRFATKTFRSLDVFNVSCLHSVLKTNAPGAKRLGGETARGELTKGPDVHRSFHSLRTGLKMKSAGGGTAVYSRFGTVCSRTVGPEARRTLLSPRITVRNTDCDII